MAREIRILPSADNATPRQVRAATIGFLLWTGLWFGLATWVAIDISHLERLSAGALSIARSLGVLAHALSGFGRNGLIGSFVRTGTEQLGRASYSLSTTGRASRGALEQLSILLGLAVALIPVLPFSILLVRLLRQRRLEAASLQRALAGGGRRREVAIRYLTRRGLMNLPYRDLVDSAGGAGGSEAVAKAELERLGLKASFDGPGGRGMSQVSVPSDKSA